MYCVILIPKREQSKPMRDVRMFLFREPSKTVHTCLSDCTCDLFVCD